MATCCSSVMLGGRLLHVPAGVSQSREKGQSSRLTKRQLSTSCFLLEPFTLATLPTVDFGWTFNSTDACSVGGQYCNINDYGSTLQTNKLNIGAAADRVLADERDPDKKASYKALMLAVAMQESKLMDHREASMDGDPLSMNCSVLNVNCDLLQEAGKLYGRNGEPPIDQNVDCNAIRDQNLDRVLLLLRRAFDVWTPKRTLDFIRGGSTGFKDGIGGPCNCPIYRRAINSLYLAFSNDSSLLTDGRRGDITVKKC